MVVFAWYCILQNVIGMREYNYAYTCDMCNMRAWCACVRMYLRMYCVHYSTLQHAVAETEHVKRFGILHSYVYASSKVFLT